MPHVTTCMSCQHHLDLFMEGVVTFYVPFEPGCQGTLYAKACTTCGIVYDVQGYYRASDPAFKLAYPQPNPRWIRVSFGRAHLPCFAKKA